jgi:hypothetical protein
MTTEIAKTYAAHYFSGLGASCWNAGISAVYAAFGQSVGGVMIKDIPFPTLHEISAIFIGAAALEALAYFKQNPLPVSQPTKITI